MRRDKIIRRLSARIRGEETTTNNESNVTTDSERDIFNEEGELSATEEERTNVIQYTDLDDRDYD